MNDMNPISARSAARRIADGPLTPGDLVTACLERIDARESAVRAWTVLDRDHIDRELARIAAIPVDERGALYGVPVGVKDVYDTADLPTAYGSAIYEGNRPAADAAAVARLRAAGAVILGKTVTTEFAYWKAGKTCNPHDPERTPGGSSSGSAAAVADTMIPLAIGTQTVASTIRPAAFCGIVGFKPSLGRVPTTGIKALAGSLDTVGVFARSVSDAGLIAGVMGARTDWIEAAQASAPPSIAIVRTSDWGAVRAEGIAAVEQVASTLRAAGARLHEYEAPPAFARLSAAQDVILAFEAARDLSHEWRTHRDGIGPQLADLIERGLATAPADYEAAAAARLHCAASLDALFGEADLLLAPSAVGEAPPLSEGTGDPVMSRAWTLLGLPSLSLPCGTGPAGLPLGLQLGARPGQDALLLGAARWIETQLA